MYNYKPGAILFWTHILLIKKLSQQYIILRLKHSIILSFFSKGSEVKSAKQVTESVIQDIFHFEKIFVIMHKSAAAKAANVLFMSERI